MEIGGLYISIYRAIVCLILSFRAPKARGNLYVRLPRAFSPRNDTGKHLLALPFPCSYDEMHPLKSHAQISTENLCLHPWRCGPGGVWGGGLNCGNHCPVAVPGIFVAVGAASSSADRGHSLRSLHPPPAALPSLPPVGSLVTFLPKQESYPAGRHTAPIPAVQFFNAKIPRLRSG